MLETILLIFSVCLDSFTASIAYGAKRIKIPFLSAFIISAIGAGFLSLSLIFADSASKFIPRSLSTGLSFWLLFVVGVTTLFSCFFKTILKKNTSRHKQLVFKLSDFRFVFELYLDETMADTDHSKNLSPKEAFFLAVALSIDSLAVGFGCGLSALNSCTAIACVLVLGIVSIVLGSYLGKILAKTFDLSWLGGIALIVLAFLKTI